MSIRLKLLLVTLFVALAPLLVSGFTALRIHQSAFDEQLEESQRQAAAASSELVRAFLDNADSKFTSASRALPWFNLNDKELAGAVTIVHLQDDDIAVAALLDQTGNSIVPSAFRAPEEKGTHKSASQDLRERFIQSVVLDSSGDKTILGLVFKDDGDRPMIPISVPVKGRDGQAWFVVMAWSLDSVCRALTTVRGARLKQQLIDRRGLRLCSKPTLAPISAELAAVAGSIVPGKRFTYGDASGELVAVAASPHPGWLLLVEQEREAAEKPSQRIQQQTLYWIAAGLVIAIFAGLFLAQGISKRVGVLKAGAEALARGDLEERIDDPAQDELGLLATTFNDMAGELGRRRKEIEAFNEELQGRVDERTRELKVAQKQLLQSQKVAAVSSLAAGFAHEINNPLTGVLGLSQMLVSRLSRREGEEKTVKALTSIESQAQRIREIVATLQGIAEEESSGLTKVTTASVVEPVTNLISELAAKKGVNLSVEVAEDVSDISADPTELTQAILHVVRNGIVATEEGGEVRVRAMNGDEGLVKIVVTDTGVGIAPEYLDRLFEPFFTTKQEWGSRGLGLTVAYRIIEQHRGTVDVKSVVGEGTEVTIVLPAFRKGALLV